MAAIKRFFEKRKLEVKFKKAGTGHKLTEDTRTKELGGRPSSSQSQRSQMSQEAQKAAEAALARLEQPRPGQPVHRM